MPGLTTKKLSRIVIFIWIFALAAAIVFVVTLLADPGYPAKALFLPPTQTIIEHAAMASTPLPSPTINPLQAETPAGTSSLPSTIPSTPTHAASPTEAGTPKPYSEGPIVIGSSVEDRPIEVYRFGTGPAERLIVAGMHGGGEYNTIQLADQLIRTLQEHPEMVPADVTVYILRDLNPDGEARSHSYLGRSNAHGVDLNRNWDANWHEDWPREGCWIQTPVTGGTVPGSEPETKALMKFIETHNLAAIINYHSAALGIFAGGLPPDDKSIRLAEAIAAVSTYSYPPIDTGCQYTGGFIDWAVLNGVAAVDLELTDHTNTDLEMNLKILQVFLNWKP